MRITASVGCKARVSSHHELLALYILLATTLLQIIKEMVPWCAVPALTTTAHNVIDALTVILGGLRDVMQKVGENAPPGIKSTFQDFLNFAIDFVIPLIEEMEPNIDRDSIEPPPPYEA